MRKIDASGIVTTVAGPGVAGISGDGGSARLAQLYFPLGVAVDGKGNLYIGDKGNGLIRRVSSTGVISTYAGTGEQGFKGDGGPTIDADFFGPGGVAADNLGNLFVADEFNYRVRLINPAGLIKTVAGNGGFHFFRLAPRPQKHSLQNPTV